MPILFPRKRKGKRGKRTGPTGPRKRAAVIIMPPLKNRPISENVCGVCGRLKKGTTENKILYEYICRDKGCRTIAKERAKQEKQRLKDEEREDQRRLEQEARDYERSVREKENPSNDKDQ